MKSIKSKLTQLRKRIEEILPNENDILGFAGISKIILLQSLSDTYKTLDLLSEYETKLEGILLQRTIADLTSKANNYLKDKFKQQEPNDFNEFLFAIGEIHYKTRETYILLTKEPIRLDSSLAKAKELLVLLENQNIEIQPLLENLTGHFKSTQETAISLSDQTKDAATKLTTINNLLTAVQSQKKKADMATQNIIKNEEKVNAISTESAITQSKVNILNDQLQKMYETLATDRIRFESTLNDLQSSIIKNSEHQQRIQETIEDASRSGMASSFKKRKDELGWPYWIWGGITVATIAVLIWVSFNIIELFKAEKFTYEFLLIRVPILAGFVWLGWFSAKQFGFVSRIREDYSYKYAVSLAFEGYRKATKEIDENLLINLLSLTLQNISTSPLNIFETNTNHGTPVNEMLSGWKKAKVEKKIESNNKPEKEIEE